jgi:hypothetical protein
MASENFRSLLDKPAEDFKRPPAFPDGTYLCRTGRIELKEPASEDKNAFFRVTFKPIKAFELPDGTNDIDEAELGELEADRWGRESFSRNFVLTPDALHRFTKGFCQQALGIKIEQKTVKQLMSEVPDKTVGVKVTRVPMYNNPDELTNEVQGFVLAE